MATVDIVQIDVVPGEEVWHFRLDASLGCASKFTTDDECIVPPAKIRALIETSDDVEAGAEAIAAAMQESTVGADTEMTDAVADELVSGVRTWLWKNRSEFFAGN
jgi:hypothetical protein